MLLLFAWLACIAGCGVGPQPLTAPLAASRVTGAVHGGQQPVAGANIQLYAVSLAADGAAATPLLTQAVTTDTAGTFSLTGLYSCGSATDVYLLATGGDPGMGAANPNLAEMAALGPCSSLTASTFISVNEVTTVASVAALAPFMSGPDAVGADTGDFSIMASAFTMASSLAGMSSGMSPGAAPPGAVVPTQAVNALANILSACVNSPGGLAADGSPCGNLFALTSTAGGAVPRDTVTALLNVFRNPSLHVAELFELSPPVAPFQPTLAVAPSSFALAMSALQGSVSVQAGASSLLFPATAVGTTSLPQNLTLRNTGSTAVTLESLAIVGPNAAEFAQSSSTCDSSLPPGGNCSISLTVTPLVAGTRTAFLAVASGGAVPMQIVSLAENATGTAGAPLLYLTPGNIIFVSQPAGASYPPRLVTLRNIGSASLVLSSITLSGSSDVSLTNSCPASLPPYGTCTLSVGFTPASSGTRSATVHIVSNAAASPLSLAITNSPYVPHDYPSTLLADASLEAAWSFNIAGGSIPQLSAASASGGAALIPTGPIAYARPSYDPTRADLRAIQFSAGAQAVTNIAALADHEWTKPFTVEATLANLQIPRSGGSACYFIAGKLSAPTLCGAPASPASGYALLLLWDGYSTRLCAQFAGSDGTANQTGGTVCGALDIPNGPPVQLTATWPGNGDLNGVLLYINSIPDPVNKRSFISTQLGFGGILGTTVTAGGIGYADSFTVTYTGGGAGCIVGNGTATAVSGAVVSVSSNLSASFGCTSAPTPVFSAGGGTGAVGATILNTASMLTDASFAAGDRALTYGSANITIAAAAVFHEPLGKTSLAGHFAALDWHNSVLPPRPAAPQLVLLDNDWCQDTDGPVALILSKRLTDLGYFKPIGVVATERGGLSGSASALYAANYLALAGLSSVPVGAFQTSGTDTAYCGAVNASLAATSSRASQLFPSSTAVYRKALATAGSPVTTLGGGPLSSLAGLLASSADAISGSNGSQLIAAHVQSFRMQGSDYPREDYGDYNFSVDTNSSAAVLNPGTGTSAYAPSIFYGGPDGSALTPNGTFALFPATSFMAQTWTAAQSDDSRPSWDSFVVLHTAAPGLFSLSANSTFFFNPGNGYGYWGTAPSNQFETFPAVSDLVLQSLVGSLLFTDLAQYNSF